MLLRIALRRVRGAPAFSATVIALVAVTVCACVLLGTIAARTLLVPSSPVEPHRLVRLYTADETRMRTAAGRYGRSSIPEFREMQRALVDRAQLAAFATARVTGRTEDAQFTVNVTIVTPAYFEVAGIVPFLGDAASDADAGAVISHDLWVRRFDRSSAVLGTVIKLGDVSLPIRAVMPQGFDGTDYARVTEAWVPVSAAAALLPGEPDPALYFDDRRFSVIGRLEPNARVTDLEPGLRAAALDLQRREKLTNARRGFVVVPFPRLVGVAERATLGIDRTLLAAALLVGALVLLAYANIANLFAVRALLSAREIAIRKALGGGDRELLADSLGQIAFLVAPGVLIGWALARGASSTLLAASPLFAHNAMSFDATTVVALLVLGMLATVALGAVPAYWAHTQTPGAALREADGDTPLRNGRVLWGLVAVQVTIASCAGGLVYTGLGRVRALEAVVAGFDMDRVMDTRIQLRVKGMGAAVHDEVLAFLDRVRRIEGVEATATAETPLLGGFALRQAIGIAGRTFPAGETPNVRFEVVGPDYFTALGLSMQAGGFSGGAHLQDTFSEIVVNRAFADAYLPAGRELEQTVLLREEHPVRVAGVVQNALTEALVEDEEPRMYLPHRRAGATGGFQLVIRTRGNAVELAPRIDAALQLDAAVERADRAEALSVRRARVIAPVRSLSLLMTVLGITVATLVTIGAYGLLAVSITSVRRSTAIRVALGASPRRVILACVRPLLIAFGVGTLGAVTVAAIGQRVSAEQGISIVGVTVALPFLAAPMALAAGALLRRVLRRSPAEVLRV